MTQGKPPLSDLELDELLSAARREVPEPSTNLVAAVLSDAAGFSFESRPIARARASSPGRMAAFLNGIGGWKGAATVAASGMLGLWVGYAGLSELPLVGGLGSRAEVMLNGDSGFDPITTFDDFTQDG